MIRFPGLNRAVRIAVVGTDRIGDNGARSWSRRDHEVQIGFSRHPDPLVARAARLMTQSADEARLPTDPESPGLSSPTSSGACAGR
jgi:predicted dinucleotide-binding enzyme